MYTQDSYCTRIRSWDIGKLIRYDWRPCQAFGVQGTCISHVQTSSFRAVKDEHHQPLEDPFSPDEQVIELANDVAVT
jgi:hypothetical protein